MALPAASEGSFFVEKSGRRELFVSLRRDHLLAAVETGRADVVTAMHFTGRSFDRGGRVGQKVVSTVITALVGGFLVLLNSHGKPHVYKTSDITSGLQDGTR